MGFEPGSSRYEADSIQMCYRALGLLAEALTYAAFSKKENFVDKLFCAE